MDLTWINLHLYTYFGHRLFFAVDQPLSGQRARVYRCTRRKTQLWGSHGTGFILNWTFALAYSTFMRIPCSRSICCCGSLSHMAEWPREHAVLQLTSQGCCWRWSIPLVMHEEGGTAHLFMVTISNMTNSRLYPDRSWTVFIFCTV